MKEYLINIPELNVNNKEKIVCNNGIEKAPDIILLDDSEKFKDNNDILLEIETRGVREYDKIFFKVKDVANAFDHKRLQNYIIDEDTNYIEDTHYKYFACETIKSCKKELFLTFCGFRKVIETSRRRFTEAFKQIANKWLYDLFDNTSILYNVDLNNIKIRSNLGYVYCATSPTVEHVKIGAWRSNINSLFQRYQTYYGNNLNLYYYKTYNAFELEKSCHKFFSKNLISNELFSKSNLDAYLNYLDDHSIKINDKIFNDIMYEENNNKLLNYNSNNIIDDKNNFLLNIETVNNNNILYFNCSDLEKELNMNLYNTILNDKIFINDYIIFTSRELIKKELFLTYEGLLRVLFVTRNGKTSKFIKWATEILFAIQLGTKEQKQKIIGDILGVSAKVVKEVFNCDTNTLPCVYLFTLGYVKDLRESMNIDIKYNDNNIICKYGRTDNLSRRTKEHLSHYKKIKNSELKLKYYSYIDPQYISNAENDIKNFIDCLNLKFNYSNEEEIIIIPNDSKYLKLISEKYEHIGKKYAGHISELISRIKELENYIEKQELKYNLEKEKLLSDLNLQKEKYEHELLKKDYKLLQYQSNV